MNFSIMVTLTFLDQSNLFGFVRKYIINLDYIDNGDKVLPAKTIMLENNF